MTAVDRAVNRMAEVFDRPGKAALALFLRSLPIDTMITWDGDWVAAHALAEQLAEGLTSD